MVQILLFGYIIITLNLGDSDFNGFMSVFIFVLESYSG